MQLFRVILPVEDIDAAAAFWTAVLGGVPGERVTGGRHYFDCGGTLLACWDPLADGDPAFPGPNHGTVYLATDEPLPAVRERALAAGAVPDEHRGGVARQPWGEHSFYARDPWGNRFCVVEAGTEYRGGHFSFPVSAAGT
ncbi:MAG: hypothetical protein QOE59_1234 [Actinomycetota bacterium]|jgi:catechol 2,3-dioxygenase-like lactoylglutathione lyase family enzyme|nr:hypothetical protein [Actinomycetota bacterium]